MNRLANREMTDRPRPIGLRRNCRAVARWLRFVGAGVLLLLLRGLVGCGRNGTSSPFRSDVAVTVLYQGKPLGDIEVRLYRSDVATNSDTTTAAEPNWVGFSDAAVVAYLSPAGEVAGDTSAAAAQTIWLVAVRSDGDSGWTLDPRLGDPERSGLTIRFADSPGPTPLNLPDQAIRSL